MLRLLFGPRPPPAPHLRAESGPARGPHRYQPSSNDLMMPMRYAIDMLVLWPAPPRWAAVNGAASLFAGCSLGPLPRLAGAGGHLLACYKRNISPNYLLPAHRATLRPLTQHWQKRLQQQAPKPPLPPPRCTLIMAREASTDVVYKQKLLHGLGGCQGRRGTTGLLLKQGHAPGSSPHAGAPAVPSGPRYARRTHDKRRT